MEHLKEAITALPDHVQGLLSVSIRERVRNEDTSKELREKIDEEQATTWQLIEAAAVHNRMDLVDEAMQGSLPQKDYAELKQILQKRASEFEGGLAA